MRSKYPKKKEYLYNLGKDPYEQNNLAMSEPKIKSLLHEKLNIHIESMPEQSWPQSVFMPVVIDKPQTKYEEGDELIYWPN